MGEASCLHIMYVSSFLRTRCWTLGIARHQLQMSQMNRHLSGIVTLFVATKPEFGYLSSSLVKQVAGLGGSVDSLVPAPVMRALKERLGHD